MKLFSAYFLSFLMFLLLTCIKGQKALAQYPSQNIQLHYQWDTTKTITEPIYHIRYNSVWGWYDSVKKKEYAILGSTDGTYFIEVTNPKAPVVRDFVPGRRDSCIWREYKTYQNYLYAVSDDPTNAYNQNSLQIINMSSLPDSVHVEYDKNSLIQRSHTIFIDGDKLYCGSVDMPNNGGSFDMGIYSLADPLAPVLIQTVDQDFSSHKNVHDMYVRNDTCYASTTNDGLFIYKLNSNNTLSLIGSLTNYANYGQGYNHSSALTANGKTLFFTDEVPVNLPIKALDVRDFGNFTVLDTFLSTPTSTATPHNLYVKKGDNSRLVVAHYQDGLQIFNITDPSNVTRSGFFDTAPLDCPTCPAWSRSYSGCWGAYVDLPSGIILASDMQKGLFILDAGAAMNVPILPDQISVNVYPNPFTNDFQVNCSLVSAEKFSYKITDLLGRTVLSNEMDVPSGNSTFTIDAKKFSAGSYLLSINGENTSLVKKLIKTNP